MIDISTLLTYGGLAALVVLGFLLQQHRRDTRNQATLLESVAAGLAEPASLHPVIDPLLCRGCRSCVDACPEGSVLGVISGKAFLIEPSRCIGHGACETACPFNAISLVFGSETRGVDIPSVSADFQTNVPGIYIAGELGGMGLIRNAVTQGTQAMTALQHSLAQHELPLDVVIIGAGPAGFAATLYAIKNGLRYQTIEQYTLGGTVAHFPRGKIVMTAPVDLPLIGKVQFRETTKESLMTFWEEVRTQTGAEINENEVVESITTDASGFRVTTSQTQYRTAKVLLAIGRRGTPRKLDVPGEDQSKVVYRLDDPSQYRGMRVLVVGGGDAAIEAAISVAEQDDTQVTLSYRGAAFARAKLKNRDKIEQLADQQRVDLRLSSQVVDIATTSVTLSQGEQSASILNDAVIVCAGGILPTGFLKKTGILVETHYGETRGAA